MLFGMRLRSMLRVIARMGTVCMRRMRVVGCPLVIPRLVMVCGLGVVVRSLRVMMGCLPMMMRCFLRHNLCSLLAQTAEIRPSVSTRESSAQEHRCRLLPFQLNVNMR
jgi:hypothetical protein